MTGTEMQFVQALIAFLDPFLLVLIPVLWYIGKELKKSGKVQDWKIPIYLLAFSLFQCLAYILITRGIQALNVWIGIMQGFVVWVIEGQFYQVYVQSRFKRKTDVDI